ncbi:O-antigen ligase family protein [Xanthobacter wiegelii]|uniref:O-antigen ligase family protein n=1 Tax=Xanthobacter wiegelii TaxID=3119913 RepID=UPI00372B3CFD
MLRPEMLLYAQARARARERRFQLIRRALLVLAMLVEAGLPLFPRVPLTGALFAVSLIAFATMGRPTRMTPPLYLVIVIVLLEMMLFQLGTTPEMIISRSCTFLSAVFLVDIYMRKEPDQLGLDLWPIFRFMALQGIGTVILANISEGLFMSANWGDYDYRTIAYVFNYHKIATDAFAKADGFFFERGVFQLFLNLYLYFAIFVYKKKVDIVLAALGVLSTWSTIGVAIMGMLFLLSVVISSGSRSGNQSRMGIIAVIIVLAVPLSSLIVQNIQDKLYGSQSSSADARAFDFAAGMDIVSSHPIVGIGFSNDVFAEEFRQRSYLAGAGQGREIADRGMSNGIVRLFLNVGIPVAIIFLFGMFRSRLVQNPLVVGLVLFFSLISEPIIFCPFVLMIIFSGLIPRRRVQQPAQPDVAPQGRAAVSPYFRPRPRPLRPGPAMGMHRARPNAGL